MLSDSPISSQNLDCIPPLFVWSQVDNAGGHGLGFTFDQLNRLGATAHRNIRIQFYTQPPNSPDLNVLDLGAWNSLQKTVPALVYDPNVSAASNQSRIIHAVQQSFLNWNAREKCTSLFQTLKSFMVQLLHTEGGNAKQPHKKDTEGRIEPLLPQALATFPMLPIPPASEVHLVIRIDLTNTQRRNIISIPRNIADVATDD